MIKTLFDIDYLAQYEPYHISRKRGKVREMEYKRKVDKKRIPTCNIMGVNIAAINMEWLVDYLEKNISEIKGDYANVGVGCNGIWSSGCKYKCGWNSQDCA